MRVFILVISLALSFTACQNTTEKPEITDKQKKRIERYANDLIAGYNEFKPKIVKSSWNTDALKERVGTKSSLQANLLNYAFDKLLNDQLLLQTVFLMNDIRKYDGRMSLVQMQHYEHHSEITTLTVLINLFRIVKYRIELKGKDIYISDAYDFRTEKWFSENLLFMMQTFDKYRTTSKKGQQMSATMRSVNQLAINGDYRSAVEKLNQLPITFRKNNFFSLIKLEYAVNEGEAFYTSTLLEEYKYNKSLYMHYLVFLDQGDEEALTSFYRTLDTLGLSQIDTLLVKDYFWN